MRQCGSTALFKIVKIMTAMLTSFHTRLKEAYAYCMLLVICILSTCTWNLQNSTAIYRKTDLAFTLYASQATMEVTKEELIFSKIDLAASIGGYLGLFLGASLLSLYQLSFQAIKTFSMKVVRNLSHICIILWEVSHFPASGFSASIRKCECLLSVAHWM